MKITNNLREKFSPGPGIEPTSPALRAGAITTKLPKRSTGPSQNSPLIRSPLPSVKRQCHLSVMEITCQHGENCVEKSKDLNYLSPYNFHCSQGLRNQYSRTHMGTQAQLEDLPNLWSAECWWLLQNQHKTRHGRRKLENAPLEKLSTEETGMKHRIS